MGYTPPPRVPPRPKPLTALEHVREQYVRGDRDLDGLERGALWLMRHKLDDTHQQIDPLWPPADQDGPPTAADPLLTHEITLP